MPNPSIPTSTLDQVTVTQTSCKSQNSSSVQELPVESGDSSLNSKHIDSLQPGDICRQPQFTSTIQPFVMFLIKAIEKISNERETKKVQNAAVRKACEESLEILRSMNLDAQSTEQQPTVNDTTTVSNPHLPPLRSECGVLLADEKLLRPFQLACSMKSAKIVSTAIDSLQKLIAYGHVPNDAVQSPGKARIIEQVVTTICSSFQGIHTDDSVQLQVLKALLTVVTSSVVEIHEADLLLVVRTCYNIFMAAKNPINQSTARATLTQIISIIFQRMEQNALEATIALERLNPEAASLDSSLANYGVSPTEPSDACNASLSEDVTPSSNGLPDHNSEDADEVSFIVRTVLDDIINSPKIYGSDSDQPDADSESDIVVNGSRSVENETSISSERSEVQQTQSTPSNRRSSSPSNSILCDRDDLIGGGVEQSEVIAVTHVTQKDAFLVFRSLCRLSMKDFGGTRSSDPKSGAARSKTLSLQLLLSILQQPGKLFLTSEIFITAIKQYLFAALLKNGTSPVPEICQLSVSIFLTLFTHFKPHLKRQTELFFKDVLLEVLDSPKSSFEHKWIVVQALHHICSIAQCVVDIYLNYDCDLNMANIFQRMTTTLAKLAQGHYAGEVASVPATQNYRQLIRSQGLECLVLILRCMADWSRVLYVSPESQSFLGTEPSYTSIEEEALKADGKAVPNESPALDDPEDFASRKAQKDLYETGIRLFNDGRQLQGLQLLQKHGLVADESVDDVAQFFRTEARLKKEAIGDFLGQNDAYSVRVMYAYVDQFDFADRDFVSSIREFLSGFRLPGEAQKIDRLMEKFASRYCACNPANELFASADTAYVLAFSIIILTTDLHSSQIKARNRMTQDDYIRMNRGINDSQDLPEEYLAQIYKEIARCGIRLKTEDNLHKLTEAKLLGQTEGTGDASALNSTGKSAGTGDVQEDYPVDYSNDTDFTFGTHCDHVRPMFKLTWTPFLAAFSVGLQDCDALDVTHLCLEGIRYAIRIACIFQMETERDAYVQALSRFTLLLTSSSVGSGAGSNTAGVGAGGRSSQRPRSDVIGSGSTTSHASGTGFSEAMKQKNIDTIRTLITVAQTDGNYLGRSWLDVLRCISQLESTHFITPASFAHNAAGSTVNGLLSRAASFDDDTKSSHAPPPASSASNAMQSKQRNSFVSSRSVQDSSIPDHAASPPSTAPNAISERITAGTLAAATFDSKKAAVLHEVMGETGSHSVVVAVDKVFTGSVRLNGQAIVDFVKALCQVSHEELTLPQPRIFTLQKVVEISYYNLGRIRLQWSRIWEHIGDHFTTAGQSANEDVAEFVIDSLRQLAVKLIEKGEFPNFHFQKEFLRPFVSILDSKSGLTRKLQDMVIRCVSQLVHSQYFNIRSGWGNIFAAFHRVAGLTDEELVHMAFESCSFTVTEVLKKHIHVLAEAFQPLIEVLADFACNPRFPDTAMDSIRLMRIASEVLSENAGAFTASNQSMQTDSLQTNAPLSPTITASTENGLSSLVPTPTGLDPGTTVHVSHDEDAVWLKGWMPILCDLLRVICSCKLDVRTRGLTVLFEIIKTYGKTFKALWWREAFVVVFRIFQRFPVAVPLESTGAKLKSISSSERTEWMDTTCNHALFSVVDVFTQYFTILSDLLLGDVYAQIKWCCLQDHKQLARSGTSCLETLVLSSGKQFTPDIWQRTIDLIVDLFKSSVPHQLLTWRPRTSPSTRSSLSSEQDYVASHTAPLNNMDSLDSGGDLHVSLEHAQLFDELLIKCVVQYELIQTVDHILFYSAHSRNENAYYLNEARNLARSTYPAYAAATTMHAPSSAAPNTAQSASWNRQQSFGSEAYPNIYTGRMNTDADHEDGEMVETKPEEWRFDPGGVPVKVGTKPLPSDPRGMYDNLSPEQRLALARCLLESHAFAKEFNSNEEQRNALVEAGFLVRAKPNLLNQETRSLLCALRILFRLADEETHIREKVEELLDRVIADALSYYHGLVADAHRQAWDPCLILLINQLTRLTPATRFHRHATFLYPVFCNLVSMAGGISPEVASLIRLFLLRCGAFFVTPSECDGRSSR